jgi:hypothetical protein
MVISIVTILSTNHFCFRRICQPVIPDYSEQSLQQLASQKIEQPRQHEWGPGWKLVVYLSVCQAVWCPLEVKNVSNK